MMLLSAVQVFGDEINVSRTHPNHFGSAVKQPLSTLSTGKGDFSSMLMEALQGASSLQQEADRLGTQMITNPDSVEPHDVTIAMAKANLAVSLTKAVVDRALRAYTDIINIR